MKLSHHFKNKPRQISEILRSAAKDGTLLTKYNIGSVTLFGGIGHPLYYYLHYHLFGQKWQNFALSMIAGASCLLLASKEKWPQKIKFLFPFYWHFVLIFNLPFLVTLIAVGNGFVDVWPAWWIAMIFFLIMLVPSYFMFIFDMMVGLTAVFIYKLLYPSYGLIDTTTMNFYWYFTVVAFALIAGTGFSYSNLKGTKEEVERSLKFLAGSIAHEMRNPFMAIHLAAKNNKEAINEVIAEVSINSKSLSKETLSHISSNCEKIINNLDISLSAIKRGGNVIDVTLNEISEQKINSANFVTLNIKDVVEKAVKEYGYKSNKERSRIINNITMENNFIFKGDENLMIYVLFNLFKNALYYSGSHPNLTITIDSLGIGNKLLNSKGVKDQIKNQDEKYNYIHITDSGPGIPPNLLPKLFNDFTTSKKDGTGLGLSFCKKTMTAFGGSIGCESTEGKYTSFVLRFPVMPNSLRPHYL